MGALHEGHLSLIRMAKKQNDKVIVSIFVNPTQFDNASDLELYPSTFDKDKEMLFKEGVDFIFNPSSADIYPNGLDASHTYQFNGLDEILEGAKRPGHFDGVAKIVSILLRSVQADKVYMGQKDYQQCLIVKTLADQMNEISTKVIICPIIRENNGLAMSSRNMQLNDTEKEQASILYQTLNYCKLNFDFNNIDALKATAIKRLKNTPLINDLEYFEILDAKNLQEIDTNNPPTQVIACIAAKTNKIRLIDNMLLIS